MSNKVLITGGPGTGKTSIAKELSNRGYFCFPEIVRDLKLSKRNQGINNYFDSNPLEFTEKLFKLRINQYKKKINSDTIFYDRGPIDSLAYLHYKGINYPDKLIDNSKSINYDFCFIANPWKKIYVNDEIREESFDQCKTINKSIISTYEYFDIDLISLPYESINDRVEFILEKLKT